MDCIEKLRHWFLENKRDFPWRENPTPYAVWVSEVMLQQTRASVVIPYFLSWMRRFPTIQALANAKREEVIKEWEGLGYYSRARNLHDGAKQVIEEFGGEIPQDEERLKLIKGIGPYTLGAIRSFAFHQKAAAVDGNVIRVLTRFYGIEDDISKPKVVNAVRECAEAFLPEKMPWEISEALIELGATHCNKQANCKECPLKSECRAFGEGKVDLIPFKSKKIKIEQLYRSVCIIRYENLFLIRKCNEGEIMSDLHEFPFFEYSKGHPELKKVMQEVSKQFHIRPDYDATLKPISHSFTKYKAFLDPHIFFVKKKDEIEGYLWKSLEELQELPFSSGHRRILQQLKP